MRYFFCLWAILCLSGIKAQPIKPLSVGDTIPEIVMNQIINAPFSTSKLASFKGKLILLDFWATWCGACIKNFDKLDYLQRKYNDNMQVLLINTRSTGDNNTKIKNLLDKLKNSNGHPLSLLTLTQDTFFNQLFPHTLLPHYVWLDRGYKIIGITGGDAVTEANVMKILQGNQPNFFVKKDNIPFDRGRPLFVNNNGGDEPFRYRSLLTGFARNLPSGSYLQKETNGLISRISITNTPILLLYKQAYQVNLPTSRIVSNDSLPFDLIYKDKDETWLADNSYCYELVIPSTTQQKAYVYMQQDLERYFGLYGYMKNDMTDCYVLTADSALIVKIKTKGSRPVNHLYEVVDKEMVNRPITTLNAYLNSTMELPVVDETNIPFPIDIKLPEGRKPGLKQLQEALSPYGIYISPAKRKVEQFFISASKKK